MKKEALKEYAEAFHERNPNLAVYNMMLHDDEANPHLHINYVPNFESSRGLTGRFGMDRALQQHGIKGTELITNWRQLETAYIEFLAKEYIPEFERANVGSRKDMTVRQYKEYAKGKSTVENQIHEKEMQVEVFDYRIRHAEEKVEELQIVKQRMESDVVDAYKELQDKMFGKADIMKKQTKNYVL